MDQHIAEPGVNFPVTAAHINSKRYFVLKDRIPTDDEGRIGDVCFVVSDEKNVPPEPEVLSPFELIRTLVITPSEASKDVMFDRCFSSEFRNYVILFESTEETKTCAYRLTKWDESQQKSLPNVENVYVRQQLNMNDATPKGVRATETWAHCFSTAGTQRSGYTMYFYGPFEARPTAHRSVSAWDSLGARILDYATTHGKSESFDGIQFIQTNGEATISGTFSIYGVRS